MPMSISAARVIAKAGRRSTRFSKLETTMTVDYLKKKIANLDNATLARMLRVDVPRVGEVEKTNRGTCRLIVLATKDRQQKWRA